MISFLPCETFLPKVFLIFLSFHKAVFVGKKMVVNTCWASMNLSLISIRLISKHSVLVSWWTIELINALPYNGLQQNAFFLKAYLEKCVWRICLDFLWVSWNKRDLEFKENHLFNLRVQFVGFWVFNNFTSKLWPKCQNSTKLANFTLWNANKK